MSAVIIDGKKLAKQAKENIAAQIKQSNKKLGLGTILVGDDPGSMAYVEGKHRDCAEVGINSIRVKLPSSVSEQEIIKAVNDLNSNPECTGFIVQLPLPKSVNTEKVLLAIDPKKDADGLHPVNLGNLVLSATSLSSHFFSTIPSSTYSNLASNLAMFSFLNPGSYKPGLRNKLANTADWPIVNFSTVVPK